jgi:hypothetical protein
MLEHPEKFGTASTSRMEIPEEFLSKKGLADKILKENALQREAEEQAAKRKLAIKDTESR